MVFYSLDLQIPHAMSMKYDTKDISETIFCVIYLIYLTTTLIIIVVKIVIYFGMEILVNSSQLHCSLWAN